MAPIGDALLDKGSRPGLMQVLKVFLPIGILSFGGTAANMAMFMRILVDELKWVSKTHYSELLGLVQSLPGASAAQILLCTVTVTTGSWVCGIVAMLLFMIPAAVVMALIGLHLGTGLHGSSVLTSYQEELRPLEGAIGCVAIALVAGGAWELGQKLATDRLTKGLWLMTCLACFASASEPGLNAGLTVGCLLLSGIVALSFYPAKAQDQAGANTEVIATGISRPVGHLLFWSGWVLLAVIFIWPFFGEMPPVLTAIAPYYRVGCLVFGGGPVVIPLLLFELISSNAISAQEFSMGFAVVQLMPGPMFNLAAFCGALHGGLSGASMAWAAMTLPGITMALGALPFYAALRQQDTVQRALKGVNAAAAGLMGAALLLLWKTIVGTSSPRICLSLVFAGAQQIFGVKAYWLVLLGLALGLGSMGAGVDF